MEDYILEMKHITKDFSGVRALDDVTFSVKRGSIHALVGENGAGKSTLMKVLSGVYPFGDYEGEILYNGNEVQFKNVKDSVNNGISIIHQELSLCKNMNISESIFMGSEITNGFKLLDQNKAYQKTAELLKVVNLDVLPDTPIINLGVGQQQLVEICKALSQNARLLILDESTASLTETEANNLFEILRSFKKAGVTCIYISHKLDEIFEIADNVTVLCDGRTVTTKKTSDITKDQLVSFMVGRDIQQMYPRREHNRGEKVFEVKNWTVYDPEVPSRKKLDDISFSAYKGEILGIAGLMGAGRTELAMSLFGTYGVKNTGEMYLNGEKLSVRSSSDAINCGLAYVSEDRKRYGLILDQDLKFNIIVSSLKKLLKKIGLIDENKSFYESNEYIRKLRIKTPSIEQKARNLSGGNQQKVVLSKWLMTDPKVLILDEPTRGIDVGAKVEIYNIMNDLVDQGVCVIFISSELQEVLGISDRVLVMHEGKMAADIDITNATQKKIMYYATGGN